MVVVHVGVSVESASPIACCGSVLKSPRETGPRAGQWCIQEEPFPQSLWRCGSGTWGAHIRQQKKLFLAFIEVSWTVLCNSPPSNAKRFWVLSTNCVFLFPFNHLNSFFFLKPKTTPSVSKWIISLETGFASRLTEVIPSTSWKIGISRINVS